MKFINDVITEKLIVFRRKKTIIVKELLKMNVIQVLNGKCLSEILHDENTNNYDYLIKISLNLFTEEELEKLEKQIEKLSNEYNDLEKLSIEDIWLNECDKLLKLL